MKFKSLIILFVLSVLIVGCEENTLFKAEYKYAYFCEQSGCKETANPEIRYTHDQQQSLLLQMDIQQNSLAQVGRLKEGFAVVFLHFAMGAPITVQITETSGVPLLGGWHDLKIHCALADFSEIISETKEDEDFKYYLVKKEIEGFTFNYIMMVPKNKTKNDFLLFMMDSADAVIVYGNSSDDTKKAVEYLKAKLK